MAMSGGRHSEDPESSQIAQLQVGFDRSLILGATALEYEMC
jgi:hypothetical protein